MPRPHISAELVVLLLAILTAFWGLIYAWWHFRIGLPKDDELTLWRRILASIGLIAVTVQVVLFCIPWTRVGHDPLLFGKWANWVDPAFFVAVPCVLAGKGRSRWWLLSSSIVLFISSYLLILTA